MCSAPLNAQSKPASRPSQKAKPAEKEYAFGRDSRAIERWSGGGRSQGGIFGNRITSRWRVEDSTPQIASSIRRGMAWLIDHQSRDGRFDPVNFMASERGGTKSDAPGKGDGEVGITALCLLSLLGEGSTLKAGRYKDNVKMATRWLRAQQRLSDVGAFSTNQFEHVVATCAMTETYGFSNYRILAKNALTGIQHMVEQQSIDGGWHHSAKGGASDPFTTCHAILAYKTAMHFGLVTDTAPLKRAESWIDSITAQSGRVPVVVSAPFARGVRHMETAIAASLVSRFFLGQAPGKQPSMLASAKILSAVRASGDSRNLDPVFQYLGSYALFQTGGQAFKDWSRCFSAIVDRQRDDGNFAGSWDPLGKGPMRGGRVYSTVLSVLTLQAHYRYAREH